MSRIPPRKLRPQPPAITEKERFDYAWKHFSIIADQRIKTFNFYIIVLLASFSGTISMFQHNFPRHNFCLVGFAHVIAASIFWTIDTRSCRMLEVATDALVEFESSPAFEGHAQLMLEDRRRNKRGVRNLVSYRTAFRSTFIIQIIFGFFLAANPGVFSPAQKDPPSQQSPALPHTAPELPSQQDREVP